MTLESKKVAVVGYGVEGKAAAQFAARHGADVVICDSNSDTSHDNFESQLGEGYLENIDGFDIVFRSPSIDPALLKNAKFVTSNTNWFLQNTPAVTIGVTGSKGKGTTSTLIQQLLQSIGLNTWLAGNVGKAALDILDEVRKTDVVVLEMSSFQLIDANLSPEIAVCLMIEPDHMNWHEHMGEYIDAKANITTHQSSNNVFIHHPTNQNVQKIVSKSPAQKVAFGKAPSAYLEDNQIVFLGQELMKTSSVGMIGRHNLENICAALTAIEQFAKLSSLDLQPHLTKIASVIENFKGLEHRLEFVRELNGVNFYNDTFSTMPDAAIAGIKSFDKPTVVIVGGVDKKVPIEHLAQAITKTKGAILIGEIAENLAQQLRNQGYENYQIVRGSMKDIVKAAVAKASTGDVVLLSPGTSSFDMFDSYKQRGILFKESVQSL